MLYELADCPRFSGISMRFVYSSYDRYIYDWLSYKVYIRTKDQNKNVDTTRNNNRHRHKINDDVSEEAMMLNNFRQQNFSMTVVNRIKHNLPSTRLDWGVPQGGCLGLEQPFPIQPTETQILINKLDILIEKLNNNDESEKVKTEWRTVAMTIDRCLVIFFFLVYFLTLVGCFSISPGYVP